MAELENPETFEARFAAAYRRYIDEALVAVDAAEVARAVAARPRARWIVPWSSGHRAPALAWVLLLAGLLLALLTAFLIAGARRPDPAPTLTGELTGQWARLSGDADVNALVIGDCVAGATCGSVTVADGGSCDYPLVYRSGTPLAAVFEVGETTSADAFRCGWSSYATSTMRLSLAETGALAMRMSHSGVDWGTASLYRVVDGRLPELLVGTWGAAPTVPNPTVLTLTDCDVGAACGIYRVRDTGLAPQETCDYDLTYLRPSGDAFMFEVGDGKTFGCAWGQPGSEMRVVPLGEHAVIMTLRRGAAWANAVELPRAATAAPSVRPIATQAADDAQAPALDVVADTVRDAEGGLDLWTVRTRTTLAGDLVLEVDLGRRPNNAYPWSLQAWLNTNRQGSCDPRVSAWVLTVGGGPGEIPYWASLVYQPRTDGGAWFGTQGRAEPARYDDLDYLIDEARITVVIPLADLGDPQTLGFRMATVVEGPATVTDTLEDVSRDDRCHEVTLEPG